MKCVNGRKIQNYDELKNLQAQLIESVNVKYVAGANSISENAGGIIEITLLPVKENGFYGAVSGNVESAIRNSLSNEQLGVSVCAKINRLSIYEASGLRWMNIKEWFTQSVMDISSDLLKFNRQLLSTTRHFSVYNNLAFGYSLNSKHDIRMSWFTEYLTTRTHDYEDVADIFLMQTNPHIKSNVLSINYNGRLNDLGDNITFTVEWMNRNMRRKQNFYDTATENDLLQNELSNILFTNLIWITIIY